MRESESKMMVAAAVLWLLLWVCGFVLFSMTARDTATNGRRSLPITIFSAPRPFDPGDHRQELAVRSWLSVSPDVVVVLFTKHSAAFQMAARLGRRVKIDSAIDFSFLGTPFFHSMVAKSLASYSGISVFVDPEIILMPDLITTLHHTEKLSFDWLLISNPRSISLRPHNSNETIFAEEDTNIRINAEKFQECQRNHLHYCCGRFLMAWNKGHAPLHAGVLPPFLYGKGVHNEWLVNEVLSSKFRLVFDASNAISSYYSECVNSQCDKSIKYSGSEEEKTWEHMGNIHLSRVYGSFYFHVNNIANLLLKLVKCKGKYFFMDSEDRIHHVQDIVGNGYRNLALDGRHKDHVNILQSFMQSVKRESCITDRKISVEDKCSMDFFRVASKASMPLLSPFSLELLLQLRADKDKSIVLAVAGDNYRGMLMSWVCRLQRLNVTNFIVCALDNEISKFSRLQGLPVFKDPHAQTNISLNNCHFGTECFKRVTKVKSRIVLKILKLGYNVLMSDVDVYIFENPLPFLKSFGPAILLAQSDEYNVTVPINLPRRLNSGFYYARSDPATIDAMERVVKHASISDLSEQPSFYDVLCGEGGVNRVGNDQCIEPSTNLTVVFLDRDRFPNGAYKGLWEKRRLKSACKKLGCLVIHNNWISGRQRKLDRQVHSGLWEYDSASRQCLHR